MIREKYSSGYSGLDLGESSFKDTFEPEEPEKKVPPPDYTNKIPIGQDARTGQPVFLRLQSSDRITVFGKTGMGKTTLCKRLLGCFFFGGSNVVYPNDVKNDFRTIDKYGGSPKKLIEEHKAGLYKGEEPKEASKHMFVPKFMDEHYIRGVPNDVKKFVFDIDALSQSEVETIIDPDSTKQKQILQDGINFLKNNYSDDSKHTISNLHSAIERLKEDGEVNTNAAASLISKIKTVMNEEVVMSNQRYKQDLASKIDDNFLVLSMKYYGNYTGGDSINKLDIYVSSLLRQVQQGIQNRTISNENGTIIFIDEAHSFIPRKDDRLSKREVVKLVDLGRAYDIPMLFSTQRPSQIPKEDIIDQCSYFFVAPSVPYNGLKELLKTAKIWNPSDSAKNKWMDILQRMNRFQFMMIDVERSTYRIIDPYAPLIHHPAS